MEGVMKVSMKQAARARSIQSPESIWVGASAPPANAVARATPDMEGVVLFPDQVSRVLA